VPTQTFRFRFAPAYRAASLPFGVLPTTAAVTVGDGQLDARFGPWRVRTPLANIRGTQVTGPYSLPKAAGPARLSFADRGLTFATNGERGLCISFVDPVPGLDPFGRLRHPALTVTVDDLDGLAAALATPGQTGDAPVAAR
jgi:hypothetical protein